MVLLYGDHRPGWRLQSRHVEFAALRGLAGGSGAGGVLRGLAVLPLVLVESILPSLDGPRDLVDRLGHRPRGGAEARVLRAVEREPGLDLSKTVATEAARRAAEAAAADPRAFEEAFIGRFYAGFFGWVNLAGLLAQLFLVSRILKWIGVRGALFVMPLIAFGGYALLAVAPVLPCVRIAKIAENATDYSLQNTTRHALFLPTSREAKYKARSAIDSLFVRAGDLLSSAVVFAGAQLALGPRHFAAVNLVLVLAWIALAAGIAGEHRRRFPSA